MGKGTKNLIPQAHVLTVEEQSAGGKASAAARKRRADLRKAVQDVLDGVYNLQDKEGNTRQMSGDNMVAMNIFKIAASRKNPQAAVSAFRALIEATDNGEDTTALDKLDAILQGMRDNAVSETE